MRSCRSFLLVWCSSVTLAVADEAPSFSREVLPILAENCFACHGPDVAKRDSDLRLDQRDDLLKAVDLQEVGKSELLRRVRSSSPDEQMPPPKSHKKPLSKPQIATLERWLTAGAPWGKHWSFELPTKAPTPTSSTTHPIDALILKRLHPEGLTLSPPAPIHTLQRRLSFDLTGLPPAPTATVIDGSNASIEKLVDELLASPHFGERMAMWWLDVARYSDTDGFQSDLTRTNWPWRDWVVDAFNQNLRFDRFTLEQFAGDLLPDATADQKLATCFHRNHMTNGEGGRDPEESRVDYVIDRVNTLGTVWLGLTLGCCQCHSHKFDPIAQRDYYSLTAFFNSIAEDGKAGTGAKPYLKYQSTKTADAVADATQLVERRKQAVKSARELAAPPFASWLTEQIDRTAAGFVAWRTLTATHLEAIEGTTLTQEADAAIQATGKHPNQDDYRIAGKPTTRRVTGFRLEILPHASHTNSGLSRGASGEFILTDVKLQVRQLGSSQVKDILIANAIADHSVDVKKGEYGNIKDTLDDDPRNGWTTAGKPQTEPHVAVYELAEPLYLDADEEIVIELRQRSTLGDANIGRFRVSISEQLGEALRKLDPSPLEDLAAAAERQPDRLDPKLRARLFEQFLEDHEPFQQPKRLLGRAEKQLAEMKQASAPMNVMVLEERKEPRETFVLVRGVWDKHGEAVTPDVPAAIAPWPTGADRNCVGLAKWITSPQNPLTARVFVNHVWQMFFGQGLVRTQEDFGIQGDRPVHGDVLDWLAVEFMESGWDIKKLIKTIVTSRTYQQDSAGAAELWAKDPENRLLARGARHRLPSWMLRDAALTTSGLLHPAIGGPPVRPHQPAGIWEELFMGRYKYEPSDGAAQHRRTLYAFWRRSIAPTFLFDSAQRRSCEVRVGRTNTPLHALTVLNDATYLEAARELAIQACTAHRDRSSRIERIVRSVLTRSPTDQERPILALEYDRAHKHYRHDPFDAKQLLRAGSTPIDPKLSEPELAAAMVVASMILNLDEALTHE